MSSSAASQELQQRYTQKWLQYRNRLIEEYFSEDTLSTTGNTNPEKLYDKKEVFDDHEIKFCSKAPFKAYLAAPRLEPDMKAYLNLD